MQIAFFDSTADDLTPQAKGLLFERFAKRVVEFSGYEDVVLRIKRASLEYDVEAKSRLSQRQLNGEAKAHEAALSGKEVSAFFGKLVPLAAGQAGGLDGLLISTSRLTPDGEDFLRSLTPQVLASLRLTFTTLTGQEIPKFLSDRAHCLADDALRRLVSDDTQLHPHDTWLLIGQAGDILLASVGPTSASASSHFVTYSLQGQRVDLGADDVRRLQRQIADLSQLTYLSTTTTQPTAGALEPQALPGVLAGTGWFDYKFPSPPDCFVGRDSPLQTVTQFVGQVQSSTTSVRALQILSRSGVGKSSLLLKVADAAGAEAVCETVDGRNVLVPADLRLVVAGLVKRTADALDVELVIPSRQEETRDALTAVASALASRGKVGILQLDQFESLLGRPEVFRAFLDLLSGTTQLGLPLVWVLARKNDLAATYDEGAAVDLTRLNELSHPVHLDDFSPPEERALLEHLSSEMGARISKDLAEALLTFSAGFPWLLKRICAHVLGMARAGVNPAEMARGGLRAEDLFDEDLAGLDESDKALLRVLAAHLPSTASELSRRLEGEVSFERLTGKLNDFLGRKLLRLSGDVYDTYNDVFKSYLLTGRIPFQDRYVFRVTPGAALGLLPAILEEGATDTATFARRIGGNPTATYNKLRELRLLGIVNPQPGKVALSSEAEAALEADQLGLFLRKGLRANALVTSVLDLLGRSDNVNQDDVAVLLQQQLPHIVATEKTWTTYANVLVNWLRYAGMVDLEGDHVLPRESASDELVLRRAFNLGNFKAGTFVPSVRPAKVRDLLVLLRGGDNSRDSLREHFGRSTVAAVVRDARSLDLVDDDGSTVSLTARGRALASAELLNDKDVAALSLVKPNMRGLLAAAAQGPLNNEQQREVLNRYGSASWSDQTWKWRLGLLTAWAVASGQARGGRLGLRSA